MEKKAIRVADGEALVKLGEENEKVVVLDADLAGATMTNGFKKAYPNRFYDLGIAEANMVDVAAGMSTMGLIPFCSTFAVFAGRNYDQIRNGVCYPKFNVKFGFSHAGITLGEDGGSHQAIEDIALMRVLPGMTVFVPADANECYECVEAAARIEEQRKAAGIGEPKNLEEQAISLIGTDLYEKLVKGYTQKQWGRPCTELPAFIIKRLPVRLTFDNNYFNALYQGIPVGGYTRMVKNMLEGIEVRLSADYLKQKEEWDGLAHHVIYTGPIDAYFGHCLGNLEYRSVRFETETLDIPNFQGNAAVNYTDAETPWTRIIEHKWFEFGKDEQGNDLPKTVISREYSSEWKPGDEPYYPVNDEKNSALYAKFRELANHEKHVTFGGRLGEYKYYDMDQVIAAALETARKLH